ncbi:hypothetical protein SKAU_G00225320 [Synaphobranchus kaupii]|uniref:Tumor necrosis factor receptor superfamily member 1A n=1 Tax=Synaphobranchus kaupii TaxID=118154 RepID=A0A9Q1FBR0_SYNKA|nr:hypothetical protein SKAU_G00225320 [Synaphobranchus kaupii]
MDIAQEKWKKKSCLILFLSICLGVCTATAGVRGQVASHSKRSVPCQEDEYQPRGKDYCCNKCPPGFRLLAHCGGPDRRSNCSRCPDGQFQEKTNFFRNCFPCRRCDPARQKNELSSCTNKKDAVCNCTDGYEESKIDSRKTDCIKSDVWKESTTPVLDPEEDKSYHWSLPAFLALIAVASVAFVVLAGVRVRGTLKRCQSRGAKPSPPPAESLTEAFLISPISKMDSCIQESDPVSSVLAGDGIPDQQARLPDCIPREFKLSPFIYLVLEHVPASRFKELVRRLSVSERDIERAERDNHTFKEGQHQMLKVWGESGGGGGRGALPRHLCVELVSTLRDMGLASCVEAIQEKYNIQ